MLRPEALSHQCRSDRFPADLRRRGLGGAGLESPEGPVPAVRAVTDGSSQATRPWHRIDASRPGSGPGSDRSRHRSTAPTITATEGSLVVRVLVADASRDGATEGIAERIAETLRTEGFDAVAQPARDLSTVQVG